MNLKLTVNNFSRDYVRSVDLLGYQQILTSDEAEMVHVNQQKMVFSETEDIILKDIHMNYVNDYRGDYGYHNISQIVTYTLRVAFLIGNKVVVCFSCHLI